MPKTKSTGKTNTKKAKTASKKSKQTVTKKVEEEPVVDATEVTLVEETAPPAPEPAAADSSAEDTAPAEEQDPYQRALSQIDMLVDFQKAALAEFQHRHRTTIQGLKDARKLITALKGKGKRKSSGKKGGNNSGIVGQRIISDQMRTFLGASDEATYSYTTLCSAIMGYGKDHSLQGMKTTADDGTEKVDNRYIRIDSKLKKLFANFDSIQADVAEAGKTTLLRVGKNRWVNRAGVMKLIKFHLLEAVKTAPDADADADADAGAGTEAEEEAAEASS